MGVFMPSLTELAGAAEWGRHAKASAPVSQHLLEMCEQPHLWGVGPRSWDICSALFPAPQADRRSCRSLLTVNQAFDLAMSEPVPFPIPRAQPPPNPQMLSRAIQKIPVLPTFIDK